MMSTFMGLETSKRGLNTAQSALYTIGHNVANANTPGYSRQRLNLNPTLAFPTPGLNSPNIPGQLGTGVEAGSVQRIRDSFLDSQYHTQNNKLSYYNSMSSSLTKMEGVMNDPTDSGLQSTMNKFWNSLQDLTTNSDNASVRSVVVSNAVSVADTLNYYYNSLTNVQDELSGQIDVKANEINTVISNINDLNVSISKVEPNGLIPNDLYDKRDALVDQLSGLVNVKVTSVMPTNYGIANRAVAEGLYNIELIKQDGSSYVPSINLITADQTGLLSTAKVEVQRDNATNAVSGVKIGSTTLTDYSFSGEFAALIESTGYVKVDANGNPIDASGNLLAAGDHKVIIGKYPDMLQKLNDMTQAFVNEFNYVHKQGMTLDGNPGGDFFEIQSGKDAAEGIKVTDAILGNTNLIAAGKTGAAGDNENARQLAAIKSKDFSIYYTKSTLPKELTGSFDDYYAGMIGNLGVDSASTQKNRDNTQTLTDAIEKNRRSVNAVSLDEEMTEMVKFQQSYNASAKMITVINEILDKLINNMV